MQDAATSPHIPAPLPGTAPVRCWDGNFLPIRAGVSWPLGWQSQAAAQAETMERSPDTPLLNIPQVALLLPCLVCPRWDEAADGHRRVVIPAAWLASPTTGEPGLLCHSGTQVSRLAAWQTLLLPLSPKPAWRPSSSPPQGQVTPDLCPQSSQGREVTTSFEGLGIQKNYPLRRPPCPKLQPQQPS